MTTLVNTLGLRQNGRHFTVDVLKCIFLNENVWIPINISLKFVPQGPINNIPALVQITAWRRPDDKPLSGPMMVRLPTHICATRPQWVIWFHNDGLVQDCSNSSVLAMELLQSCTKPLTAGHKELIPFEDKSINFWNVNHISHSTFECKYTFRDHISCHKSSLWMSSLCDPTWWNTWV